MITATFANSAEVGQGQIRRHQWLAAADADTAKPQNSHIGSIVLRAVEHQTVGNRRSVIVLCSGAIETVSVTAAVDEQAGPAAITATAATRGKSITIHLGPGTTECGALFQPIQELISFCTGCWQLFGAYKGQQVILKAVLTTVGLNLLQLNAFFNTGLDMGER
jgi:hypothetical protein